MIIPIRCFTCNRVLASKYETYKEIINEIKQKQPNAEEEELLTTKTISDLLKDKKKTPEQIAFEKIGVSDRYCCKRHIVTHIDLIEKI